MKITRTNLYFLLVNVCFVLQIILIHVLNNICYRMLMPKKNRVSIYEYLFKEGVMVAKKDYHAPKHPELETIPNLQVIKAMQVKVFFFFTKIQNKLLCSRIYIFSSALYLYLSTYL